MSFEIIYGKFQKAIEKVRFMNMNNQNLDIVTDVYDSTESKQLGHKPIGKRQYQFNKRYYRVKFIEDAKRYADTKEGIEEIEEQFDFLLNEYKKKLNKDEKIQKEIEIKLYEAAKNKVIQDKNLEIAEEKEQQAMELINIIKESKYKLIKLLCVEHKNSIDV